MNETYHVSRGGQLEFHVVQQELEVPETAEGPLLSFSQYVEHGRIRDIQISGCWAGDMQPLVAGHPLHIIDFVLDKPLEPGQRTTVEYTTWFEPSAVWRASDCRRRAGSNVLDHLRFAVQFDEWQPYEAWKAEWASCDPPGSNSLPDSSQRLELISGAPDIPDVAIARREDWNLAAGSVVGIEWYGD
jgi:hypothetical protein